MPAPVQPAATVAAVDGGKSSLRLVVQGPAGRRTATVPGFTYRADRADDTDRRAGAILAALHHTGHQGPVHRLCAGLTGLPASRDGRRRLRARLLAGLGGAQILLLGDVVLAHAGALRGPGVVLSAGTGAIALAVDDEGRYATADGWGPLLGDRGSGYAIGRAGLAAAFAALDGAGPATPLADALPQFLGGPPGMPLVQQLYRDPEATVRIAGFATAVAAAVRDGDPVAGRIWSAAVTDLAGTATAAARRLGLTPAAVSWSGRLFAAGDTLTGPLTAALTAAGHRPVPPAGDPLAGGLWLAGSGTGTDPRYAALLADELADAWDQSTGGKHTCG